jgi:hypothetical protein
MEKGDAVGMKGHAGNRYAIRTNEAHESITILEEERGNLIGNVTL